MLTEKGWICFCCVFCFRSKHRMMEEILLYSNLKPNTLFLQVKPHDVDGARGEGESEEKGEEIGRWGDTATGHLGQVHFSNKTPGISDIFFTFSNSRHYCSQLSLRKLTPSLSGLTSFFVPRWLTHLLLLSCLKVWKQKGEEYRVTGYGGWSWISKTYVPRFAPRLPGNTNANYRKELEGLGKQKRVGF